MKQIEINGKTCWEGKFGLDMQECIEVFRAAFDSWAADNPKKHKELFKVNDNGNDTISN